MSHAHNIGTSATQILDGLYLICLVLQDCSAWSVKRDSQGTARIEVTPEHDWVGRRQTKRSLLGSSASGEWLETYPAEHRIVPRDDRGNQWDNSVASCQLQLVVINRWSLQWVHLSGWCESIHDGEGFWLTTPNNVLWCYLVGGVHGDSGEIVE